MSDLLQSGIEWLDGVRKASMARTVTYSRGGDEVDVSATVGESELPVVGPAGVQIEAETRDYIVSTADLVLAGTAVTPEPGDRITDTVGGTSQVYEVMAPGGHAHYRPIGPDQTMCRIHTKLVQ